MKVERVTDRFRLRTVEVDDLRLPGRNGEPVAAGLLRPRGAEGPLPVLVSYIRYSGDRGLPTDHLFWPAAGQPSSSSTAAARATTPRTGPWATARSESRDS
ncbi:acetylxylan esterase [Streptomyces longisporus]|uniref:Acetyl xylan esterase domain-containing protein n=1 Tax=Streptomyces longisporus TaxID=1948 RepID=A0ABN3NHM5_STRLO